MELRNQVQSRLGTKRAEMSVSSGTVFPNFSFLTRAHTMRVWHPKGPDRIEVWSWCIVDRTAPLEAKHAIRTHYLRRFSPGGILEQDDGENWSESIAASRGVVARRYPFNYQMGIGHDRLSEDFPGRVADANSPNSEMNQRALYQRWADLMAASSWTAIMNSAEDGKGTIKHAG